MFAKVFAQIFDSSIAEDYRVRFVFEDMLKLADKNGVVDMTHEAIARRTNVPLAMVRKGIEELEKPDPRSRNPDHDGCRLARLDEHRDWGWLIINYEHYRALGSEDQRREKTKERVRRLREKKPACNAPVTHCNASETQCNDSPYAFAYASSSLSGKSAEKPSLVPTALDIYNAYPRKVAKPAALNAIRKALRSFGPAFLLERTLAYARTQPANSQFTPHPATWFNQERFNDDPTTWAPLQIESSVKPQSEKQARIEHEALEARKRWELKNAAK